MQFVVCAYCVLVPAALLKVKFGSHPPPDLLATQLRDYGVFLLLVPAVWLIGAVMETHRPRLHSGDGTGIALSGVVVLILLGGVGFVGTQSAASYGSTIYAKPAKVSKVR